MEEVFKPVKGFEGLYEISNLGRLKRLPVPNVHGKLSKEYIRKNTNQYGWYFTVNLIKNGKSYTRRMHRLVYEAFVEDIPNGYDVHHKDGNKQNNSLDNLEMLSEHEHHSMHGKLPKAHHAMNMRNMLDNARDVVAYHKDGSFFASFPNSRLASIATGVCARNINQVADRTEFKPGHIRTQAGGYKWIYKDEINSNG